MKQLVHPNESGLKSSEPSTRDEIYPEEVDKLVTEKKRNLALPGLPRHAHAHVEEFTIVLKG